MAIMVPVVLLALAGVGGLVYLQEKHQRFAAEDSRPDFERRKETAVPRTSSKTDSPPPSKDKMLARLDEAILAHSAGDLDKARTLLSGVNLVQAGSASGWELAGILKEADGDKETAFKLYSEGIAASPSEGLYYRRALLLRDCGNFRAALADMGRAVDHAPNDVLLTNERLLLLIQMGMKDQVNEEIHALNSRGGHADASGWIFALCGMALENGKYSEAVNLLALAKKSEPPIVFEQVLKNPVLSRHQGRPQIMPFYIINLKNLPANKPAK